MENNSFNYKIVEHIGTLKHAGNYATELNIISFNGGEPKYDLRKWDKPANRMYKGISLSKEEIKTLKDLLNEIKL